MEVTADLQGILQGPRRVKDLTVLFLVDIQGARLHESGSVVYPG